MDILIIRDGGATKIPRTVEGMGDVDALRSQGFEVEVIGGEPEQAVAEPDVAESVAAPAKKSAKKAA